MEDSKIDVLDHGFVRLIDVMGDDSSIVQAARVSYGKGTKTKREDTGLIRYLMQNQHWSPFEMCEVKVHVKCPIFVSRQWLRHKGNVNEYSLRYSEAKDEFYEPDEFKSQNQVNRQGSSDLLDDATHHFAKERITYSTNTAYDQYKKLLEMGVSREQARIVIPLSNYTEFYWKQNLRDALHFLRLRLDEHAQSEIREFAKGYAEIIKRLFPVTWQAFEDYILRAETFSAHELGIIRQMADSYDLESYRQDGMTDREWNQFKQKMHWP